MVGDYFCKKCNKTISLKGIKEGITFHCHKFDSKHEECFRIRR